MNAAPPGARPAPRRSLRPHLRSSRVHAHRLQVLQGQVSRRLAPPLARRRRPLLATCLQVIARGRKRPGDVPGRLLSCAKQQTRAPAWHAAWHPLPTRSAPCRRCGEAKRSQLPPTCLRRRSLGLVAVSPSSRGVLRPLRALSPPWDSPLVREVSERWNSYGRRRGRERGVGKPSTEFTLTSMHH